MRHPAAMICFNNLSLTKDAVASVFAQDIPVELWVIDNGSNDGTWEWLEKVHVPEQHSMIYSRRETNESPVKIANELMRILFAEHEYVLGLPNDVVLPPNLFSEFLKWPRGIVTGSMTDDRNFVVPETVIAVQEHTPMAVALIRRWCYEALVSKDGYFFDERMFHYGSDLDMALRISACGIRGIQLSLNYWHFCSASHRRAPSYIAEKMCKQADEDREYFRQKWGFRVEDAAYGERCGDINFRGESNG